MEQNRPPPSAVRTSWEALKGKDRERRLVQRTLVRNTVAAIIEGEDDLDQVMEDAGFSSQAIEEECGPSILGLGHTHQVEAKERFARWICGELFELITEKTREGALEDGR